MNSLKENQKSLFKEKGKTSIRREKQQMGLKEYEPNNQKNMKVKCPNKRNRGNFTKIQGNIG